MELAIFTYIIFFSEVLSVEAEPLLNLANYRKTIIIWLDGISHACIPGNNLLLNSFENG